MKSKVRASHPDVKRSGCEADHTPPSSAEVNVQSYTSTPQYAFMTWYLVCHTDEFTFTLVFITDNNCVRLGHIEAKIEQPMILNVDKIPNRKK
jgi:hypothetical protein